MSRPPKSTVEEIRNRFDQDVERFSNLETGQSAAIDAPIALELIAKAAHAVTPQATRLLDIGCGAGNFALRTMREGTFHEATLIDLSGPMLTRAAERIRADQGLEPTILQADIREVDLAAGSFDVVVAGAVLHHLRNPEEWQATFAKVHQALDSGGSFWIFDMVTSSIAPVAKLQDERYGAYLCSLQDATYRDHVFDYIEKEDTPTPLLFQLELLREVGFTAVDILHFNTRFAAFGGVKQ